LSNPLREPATTLIEIIFDLIATMRVKGSSSDTEGHPGLHKVELLKLYLQRLALRLQQFGGVSEKTCYFCATCGEIGIRHPKGSFDVMTLLDYHQSGEKVRDVLRLKAGCESCSQLKHKTYHLTDQIVCACQTYCGS